MCSDSAVKVGRKDIEALLAACEPGSESFLGATEKLTRRTLRALCQAWLEAESAPEVCVGQSAVIGEGWQIHGTDGDPIMSLPFENNQRVRIVNGPL